MSEDILQLQDSYDNRKTNVGRALQIGSNRDVQKIRKRRVRNIV